MTPFDFKSIPTYAEVSKLIDRPDVVLDIGCSEGFFLGELKGTKFCVGIDRDWERLRIGRRDRPGIAFVHADAAALPFADGTFTTVLTIGVLSYLPDVSAAVSEAARVLTPSGRFVVTTATDRPLYRLLATHLRRRGVRLLKRQDVADVMVQSGLTVVASYEKGYLVAPLLNLVYTAASLVDRRVLQVRSVIGPFGRWVRSLTNPLIRLEYRLEDRPGNTTYLVADKR